MRIVVKEKVRQRVTGIKKIPKIKNIVGFRAKKKGGRSSRPRVDRFHADGL